MAVDPFEELETIYQCLKRMEEILLGMKQIRNLVGNGEGKEMLEELIEVAEQQIADVKRKMIQ